MIQIDMPMPECCLDCRFMWHGDGCTYCLAQSYHKPEGGTHMHQISFTYHGRIERLKWREATCPLITLEPRVLTWDELVAHRYDGKPVFLEEKDCAEWAILHRVHSVHDENCDDNFVEFGSYVDDVDINPYTLNLFWYGDEWRCWNTQPTYEQREAEPWE